MRILISLTILVTLIMSAEACNRSIAPTPQPSASPSASPSNNATITANINPTTATNDAVLAEVTRLQQAGTLTDVIVRESYPVQITATGPSNVIQQLQTMATGSNNNGGASITIESIAKRSSKIKVARTVSIDNQGDWAALWEEHTADNTATPTAVDFKTHTVLAVFMGEKPTGGYSTEITKVSLANNTLTVTYTEKEPAEGSLNTTVITAPSHLVKVAKTQAAGDFSSVSFVKQ